MSFKETEVGKIPQEWGVKKVSEYTEIVTDYVANGSFASLKKNVQYYDQPNYSVLLRLTDYNNKFDGNFVFIDKNAYDFLNKTKLYGNEIIISNVGANVGTVFKVPRLKYKMNLGPNSIMLKTLGHDDFYYYWFTSTNGQESIKSILSGSAQPKFNKTSFRNLSVPVPSVEEQKAIAKILSDLDKKIEVNNKINQRLEKIGQSIFKHWFVDFEFPNEEGKSYKISGGEMVESELGMIPKGWEVVRLEDIAEIKTTSVNPQNNPDELYEHYSIPAFDQSKYPKFEEGNSIKSNKYKVFSNSVLISKLNPDTKRMWKPLALTDNAICSTEFINYVPKEEIYEELLYSVVNSDKFTEYLIQHVTGSTGSRQRVTPKETYDYKFILPKEREKINSFSRIINSINLKIRTNIVEINKLSNLRSVLLPKLMSGEIRVPIEG